MVAAVLFVGIVIVLIGWPSSVFLMRRSRGFAPGDDVMLFMVLCFVAAVALSLATWWLSMRSGVRALQEMDRMPA
jgi:hypothetical protein